MSCADGGRALPGAAEALDYLADRGDVAQSVLTGNTREVAEIKVRTFGLDWRLDFEAGSYGSDESEQPLLVAISQNRAAEICGTTFDRANTILVGDSFGDIETARLGGARVLAVASGVTGADELREHNPEAVLNSLTELPDYIL